MIVRIAGLLSTSAFLLLAGCALPPRGPAPEPGPSVPTVPDSSVAAAGAPSASSVPTDPVAPTAVTKHTQATVISPGAVTSFADLQKLAALMAAQPYRAENADDVPAVFRTLSYDQYREIGFDAEQAWWKHDPARPFQLQFFHPGLLYNHTVRIDELVDGVAQQIPFKSELFHYGKNNFPDDLAGSLGFSGFRVHYALNRPDYLDELIAFQGASYFRALGRQMHYGLSARGIAINTLARSGEEFPAFTRFWIKRPGLDASALDILALLDGPSLTGAYRFTVRPGIATVIDVEAEFYPRASIDVFGVAPLTSMFWYGENSMDRRGDFRPEVHDSDGLLIARDDGEWLWRPLENPADVKLVDFAAHNPRGFGLVQRDRNFGSYEDLEAHYHDRPSAWVEPIGDWGEGAIRLIELPTPDETNDNIVAFWVPDNPPVVGHPLRIAYRLHWFMEDSVGAIAPPGGYVKATRIGLTLSDHAKSRRFVIDFAGKSLANRVGRAEPQGRLSVGAGARILNQTLQHNPHDDSWRFTFLLEPDHPKGPIELRAFLHSDHDVLTETWSYQLQFN